MPITIRNIYQRMYKIFKKKSAKKGNTKNGIKGY